MKFFINTTTIIIRRAILNDPHQGKPLVGDVCGRARLAQKKGSFGCRGLRGIVTILLTVNIIKIVTIVLNVNIIKIVTIVLIVNIIKIVTILIFTFSRRVPALPTIQRVSWR